MSDLDEEQMRPMAKNYPTFISISLVLVLGFGLCCCTSPPAKRVDSTRPEVEAREIAFAKTMADRDFDTFQTFISPEGIFFSGNEPIRGRDAISQKWAHYFEGETAPFSWRPDVVEVLDSGRLALTSGPVRSASGEVIGRFNSIWRKEEDGQWRVIFDKGN